MSSGEPRRDLWSPRGGDVMLSVDEARERIVAAFSALGSIEVPLLQSSGRVLAEDNVAGENIPPFRNSAMDGYAVRAADVSAATPENPVRLRVVGEAAAGSPSFSYVEPGTAIRIMTGAPLPDSADAVIRFEAVSVEPPRKRRSSDADLVSIIVSEPIGEWHNVRHAGEDVARGSLALSRGTLIGARHVGLLAALNRTAVSVVRPPVVAILATGDEVVDLGSPLQPGQIRNSNSVMLASLARQFGGEPRLLGVARDTERDIIDKLSKLDDVDLLVTSGGVSVGDFDMVKQVLRREGAIDLWQVRMKPGKPLAFGHIGGTPLLGLPGNPAAAYVAFAQFGRSAIRRMLGLPSNAPGTFPARLHGDLENRGGRRHFVRAVAWREGDHLIVRPIDQVGSAALSSLVRANCFIVLPEDTDRVLHGSVVDVQPLDEESFVD